MSGLTPRAEAALAVCREAVATALARTTPLPPFVCQVCGNEYDRVDTFPLCPPDAALVWIVPGLRRRRYAELRMPPAEVAA